MGSLSGLPLGVFGSAAVAGIQSAINQAAASSTGNVYYLDPANGSDSNNGLAPLNGGPGSGIGPVATLAAGYGLLVSGHNDTLVLIGNGAASGSARIASFTWAKSATRLVGVCAPSAVSQRARIANATTAGLTMTANFFTITGSGCLFQNISWFHGAGAGQTGIAADICVTLSGGSRNVFINCDFEGMGDSTSATDAGSRCLLITAGSQEHLFQHCNFGLDTVTRTNANATIEVAGGGPRNIFEDCTFPFLSSDGLQYAFLAAGAAAMDRWVLFKRCNVICTNAGGGVALAVAFKLAASVGGILCFDSGSGLFNVTAIGDATTKAQTFVSGGTATNGVKGIVAT